MNILWVNLTDFDQVSVDNEQKCPKFVSFRFRKCIYLENKYFCDQLTQYDLK